MGSFAAVCVYDDLPAGEAGVAVGAAYHKLAGGVYMQDILLFEQLLCLLGQSVKYSRYQDVFHVALYPGLHGAVVVKLVVLGGNHNSMHSFWGVVVVVFDCELRFGVWSKVGHEVGLFPYPCKLQQCDM